MSIHTCGHAKQWVQTNTIAIASLSYKVTELGLYIGSLHLKTRRDIQVPLQKECTRTGVICKVVTPKDKEIQAPLQKNVRKKILIRFAETNII